MNMNTRARKALLTIRRCAAKSRYQLLTPFVNRLDERGLFWPDVKKVLDSPTDARETWVDRWGRPKWIVQGESAGGDKLEMECVLDRDERGKEMVFITIHGGFTW